MKGRAEESQTPLQLANLSMLMANLQKTGDLHLANEEAYRARQSKNQKSSLAHLKRHGFNGDMLLKSALDFGSAPSKNPLNDTQHSFYMTDDRGNLMKLSKSTIFEMNFDNQFGGNHMNHRMMPTLHHPPNSNLPPME